MSLCQFASSIIGALCFRGEGAITLGFISFTAGAISEVTVCDIGFTLVNTSFSLLMSFYLYLNIDMGAD
jgi:hypothetical protein